MTDNERDIGAVENNHVFTAAGWIPLRYLAANATPPFYAGDVKGGHVFTGTDWVPLPGGPPRTPVPSPSLAMPPLAAPSRREWVFWVPIAVVVLVVVGVVGWAVDELGSDDERPSTQATEVVETPTSAPTSAAPTEKKKRNKPKKAPSPADDRIIENGMWVHTDMRCEHNGYTSTVTGTITNVSGSDKSYVQITIGLFDASGTLLGNALANVTNLADGTNWKYEAVGAVGDFATCQAQEVTVY